MIFFYKHDNKNNVFYDIIHPRMVTIYSFFFFWIFIVYVLSSDSSPSSTDREETRHWSKRPGLFIRLRALITRNDAHPTYRSNKTFNVKYTLKLIEVKFTINKKWTEYERSSSTLAAWVWINQSGWTVTATLCRTLVHPTTTGILRPVYT